MRHEQQLIDEQLREQQERQDREDEEDNGEKKKFDLGKSLRKKEDWRTLRGGEVVAILPAEVRDKVAAAIAEYADAKARGDFQDDAPNHLFPEGTKTTAFEILDRLISTSKNKELVALAKRARKIIRDNVSVSFKDKGRRLSTRGTYHTDNTISIYKAATKGTTLEDA